MFDSLNFRRNFDVAVVREKWSVVRLKMSSYRSNSCQCKDSVCWSLSIDIYQLLEFLIASLVVGEFDELKWYLLSLVSTKNILTIDLSNIKIINSDKIVLGSPEIQTQVAWLKGVNASALQHLSWTKLNFSKTLLRLLRINLQFDQS